MNFAYWSSCVFTDSSTRAWIVIDFGCLGGALMIAMLSLCSSFTVLHYMLSYKVPDSLLLRGQNTSCAFQQQEAGVTPEARRDRAAILRRDGVAPDHFGALPASKLCVAPCATSMLPTISPRPWVTLTVTGMVTCVFHAPVTFPREKRPLNLIRILPALDRRGSRKQKK